MKYQILVRLKPGVLDVQGKAIENGLKDKQLTALSNIRVGKVIEMDVTGVSAIEGRKQVDEVCKSLLANPVIEHYEVKEVE